MGIVIEASLFWTSSRAPANRERVVDASCVRRARRRRRRRAHAGVGPVFWSYGAIAGNYTAIVLVGSFLLGVAYRGLSNPQTWHPFAAGLALAVGAGYRPDIGTFWLPVFAVILWQHRWNRAIAAALLFTGANVAWLLPMLHDVGGLARYRAASAAFAHSAGYLNSVWNLGIVDGPVRYTVKLAMALVWTLGPALAFVPRGLWRLVRLRSPERFAGIGWTVPIALSRATVAGRRDISPPCEGGLGGVGAGER